MKKLFLLVMFLCVGNLAIAQVTNEGEPLSWSMQRLE